MNARQRARLNQVVCTLEGMCFRLQMTPGDFAVVIHGERDCSNVLYSGMDFPGGQRFFCTNLDETRAVSGRSTERLARCLELVCRETAPSTVFLLGTCLSVLIGEQLPEVAGRVSGRCGVPIVALPGAGMSFVSQAEICDRFACLMLDAAKPAEQQEHAVNLIGFHPGPDVLGQLADLGVVVNSVLDLSAPLSAWKTIGRAGHNLVLDPELFSGFLDRTGRRFGQTVIEVPFPVGYRATAGFFEAVLEALNPKAGSTRVLKQPGERARKEVERAAGPLGGRRLGYNVGSLKNLDPRYLALEGLADLGAFEELDLQPTILVQGDDRPGRLAAVRECLAGFGCRHPLEVFSDTVFFGALCQELELDLVYAADHLRGVTGFMEIGSLQPGYTGVANNLERILGACHGS